MNQAHLKLWTKDFIILSVANFFIGITFLLLMTNVAVYAIEEFNASQSTAGLASSIFIIGALVFRLFAGKNLERIGRKKMLFGGLILFLLATLMYFVVKNINLLLLIRFIHGAAFGVTATAMTTIVMDTIPRVRLGEGTSYFSMSGALAAAIGPFLGIFISLHAGFTIVFAVCTFFSVTSIILSLFARIPEAKLNKKQLADMRGFKLKNFFEAKALPISVLAFFIGFSYSGVLTFLAAYTKEINLINAASFFFIVYAVFVLISRPFTGRLLDRTGANQVIYPSLILFSLGFILLSQSHHGLTLLLSGAIIGLGYGNIFSCSQAIAVRESPRHHIGLATSTFFIFIDGGLGVGPFLLGYTIPLLGFRGLYLALAAVVCACIFLYYLLLGKKESYRKRSLGTLL